LVGATVLVCACGFRLGDLGRFGDVSVAFSDNFFEVTDAVGGFQGHAAFADRVHKGSLAQWIARVGGLTVTEWLLYKL
jgi:hypothetical protein